MSKKSDYFFITIKSVYKNFSKPSEIEIEIWEDILEPYELDDIRVAIKSYRQNEENSFAPIPARFKQYLYRKNKKQEAKEPDLPLSPETYLMEQDIKEGRCKYFYPIYAETVEYVLKDKVKELVGKEKFKKLSRGQCYRIAVDNGLFGDFEKYLDFIYLRKNPNGKD